MVHILSEEINEFHRKIRARALLIAIEWAGGAERLARMAGLSRYAGIKWTLRQRIPPIAALSLSLISGFPLTFQEMCPDEQLRALRVRFQCPHCTKDINPSRTRTASLPLLKRRSEAVARKHAAQTHKPRIASRKP
jgi:hypothetical protein